MNKWQITTSLNIWGFWDAYAKKVEGNKLFVVQTQVVPCTHSTDDPLNTQEYATLLVKNKVKKLYGEES